MNASEKLELSPSATEHEKQDGQNLHVKIGDVMQMQMPDDLQRGRFNVNVIGLHDGRSIIISPPHNNGNLLLLREGQEFIVRSLSGTHVVGFTAEVIKSYMNPYPYVHLRVRGKLEQLNVRNANRVAVKVIASIKPIVDDEKLATNFANSTNKAMTVEVVDISTSGCLVQSGIVLDEQLDRLSISFRVEVAEHTRTFKLPADICSHREVHDDPDETDEMDEKCHQYGLKFDELDNDKRLTLHCFVYEQMVKSLYPS